MSFTAIILAVMEVSNMVEQSRTEYVNACIATDPSMTMNASSNNKQYVATAGHPVGKRSYKQNVREQGFLSTSVSSHNQTVAVDSQDGFRPNVRSEQKLASEQAYLARKGKQRTYSDLSVFSPIRQNQSADESYNHVMRMSPPPGYNALHSTPNVSPSILKRKGRSNNSQT